MNGSKVVYNIRVKNQYVLETFPSPQTHEDITNREPYSSKHDLWCVDSVASIVTVDYTPVFFQSSLIQYCIKPFIDMQVNIK